MFSVGSVLDMGVIGTRKAVKATKEADSNKLNYYSTEAVTSGAAPVSQFSIS